MLIDEEDGIIAGHGRVLAAHLLGHDEVPCIVLALDHRVAGAWRAEGQGTSRGQRSRMNALTRQARELRDVTVVEELGNRKFLPRYGFPIGLNSLLVSVAKDESAKSARRPLSDAGSSFGIDPIGIWRCALAGQEGPE